MNVPFKFEFAGLLFFFCLFCQVLHAESLEDISNINKLHPEDITKKIILYENRIQKYSNYNALTVYDKKVVKDQIAQISKNKSKLSLFGVPFVAKDNILTVDYPTSNGLRALQKNSKKVNATIINNLKEQGAILVAKANLHEFAGGITTVNHDFGAANNPGKMGYFAGGSSGGSALAVALGLVPFSLGSDTSGSVRIPASLCGVVGFRPTTHRYPDEGLFPLSTTLDSLGLFANNVKDIQYLDGIIAKNNTVKKCQPKKHYTFAIPKNHYFNNVNNVIREKFIEVMRSLYADGHKLVEIDIEPIQQIFPLSSKIILYEANQEIPIFLDTYFKPISFKQSIKLMKSTSMKKLFTSTENTAITKEDYKNALKQRQNFKLWFDTQFKNNGIDAFVYPTTKDVARKINTSHNYELVSFYLSNTLAASLADLPSISLPLGHDKDNLSFGLGLDGQSGKDVCLLELADYIYSKYLTE